MNACIPARTRTKGGVLLRVVRHAPRYILVAVLPLSIAFGTSAARAQDPAPSSDAAEPTQNEGTDAAGGDTAVEGDDAGAHDDSATHETKTKSPTYQLPPPESRWKTVGLGLGFTGAWYAGAWGLRAWYWSESPGANDLRYPIVGPWMDLYKTGCPSNDTNCGTFGLVVRTALVVIDGVGQVGGLAIALDGLFTPTASRTDAVSTASRHSSAPRLNLVPVPWSTPGGGGLSFVGRF